MNRTTLLQERRMQTFHDVLGTLAGAAPVGAGGGGAAGDERAQLPPLPATL